MMPIQFSLTEFDWRKLKRVWNFDKICSWECWKEKLVYCSNKSKFWRNSKFYHCIVVWICAYFMLLGHIRNVYAFEISKLLIKDQKIIKIFRIGIQFAGVDSSFFACLSIESCLGHSFLMVKQTNHLNFRGFSVWLLRKSRKKISSNSFTKTYIYTTHYYPVNWIYLTKTRAITGSTPAKRFKKRNRFLINCTGFLILLGRWSNFIFVDVEHVSATSVETRLTIMGVIAVNPI